MLQSIYRKFGGACKLEYVAFKKQYINMICNVYSIFTIFMHLFVGVHHICNIYILALVRFVMILQLFFLAGFVGDGDVIVPCA